MAYTEHQIYLFFLILVRITSMFLSAPVFSFRGVPLRVKIGLGGLLALIIYPLVDATQPQLAFDHLTAVVVVFKEVLAGLSIGFTMRLLFAAVELAGEYISTDMGFSMVQMYDPTFNQMDSVIARLENILAVLIFLIIDGHHFLVEAVVYSFQLIHVGEWTLSGMAINRLIFVSSQIFAIGVKIAAPAIVALFLTSVAMGIIARAVPQMNIFFVGIPLRIGVGLFFLTLGFPIFIYLFHALIITFESHVTYLLQVM